MQIVGKDVYTDNVKREIKDFLKDTGKPPNLIIFNFKFAYNQKQYSGVIKSIDEKNKISILYDSKLKEDYILAYTNRNIKNYEEDKLPF